MQTWRVRQWLGGDLGPAAAQQEDIRRQLAQAGAEADHFLRSDPTLSVKVESWHSVVLYNVQIVPWWDSNYCFMVNILLVNTAAWANPAN